MAKLPRHNVRFARFDAATNLFLSRELESVDKQAYEELNAGVLARKYFPTVNDVDPWDIAYTYKMFKVVGRAIVSSRGASNAPAVTLSMTPATATIKEITDSYRWTVAEIERASRKNVPLDRLVAMGAKAISDRKIDDMLGTGDSDVGITGALNIAGVTPATASTKTSGTAWNATNSATDTDKGKILADVMGMFLAMNTALRQTDAPGFQKFVLLVPVSAYTCITMTKSAAASDMTILKFLLANCPWLEAIEPWAACDTAGSGGVGRAMLYPRNPMWGGALVPMDFYSLPPQESGQDIIVPTRSSCGGVVCRYAVATQYLDGV